MRTRCIVRGDGPWLPTAEGGRGSEQTRGQWPQVPQRQATSVEEAVRVQRWCPSPGRDMQPIKQIRRIRRLPDCSGVERTQGGAGLTGPIASRQYKAILPLPRPSVGPLSLGARLSPPLVSTVPHMELMRESAVGQRILLGIPWSSSWSLFSSLLVSPTDG